MLISRGDRSILGQWWWSVDRWLLSASVALIVMGALISFAASPGVAERIHVDTFFFVRRHMTTVMLALFVLLATSVLSVKWVRWICWIGFFSCFLLLISTPFIGTEIKGARRWINVFGFSCQVSEFIKPTFSVVSAWLLAWPCKKNFNIRWAISMGFFISILFLLLFQPDFGMAFVLMGTWGVQIFLAGLAMKWIAGLLGCAFITAAGAYACMPHVCSRVERFFNPAAGDMYQIKHSLDAFVNGGLFGQGPGEGVVKRQIPDAHADFVFSVVGEEFGYIFCLFILLLFMFIIGRTLYYAYMERALFVTLALTGVIMAFALQTFINTGSSLRLIPTKGMTLPFISYGGSSLLAVSFAMGIVLSLSRKNLVEYS